MTTREAEALDVDPVTGFVQFQAMHRKRYAQNFGDSSLL